MSDNRNVWLRENLGGDYLGLVDEFLEYLRVEKQVSVLTIRNYRFYLERFGGWVVSTGKKSLNVSEITVALVRGFRVWLADQMNGDDEPLSASTQAYHVIALRSLLKYLVKNDHEVLSPDKLELPRLEGGVWSFCRLMRLIGCWI